MRLAVFATHPIQYQVPIWRALASTEGLEVVVHYFSDFGIRSVTDPEFGVPIVWDAPLLDGYESVFVSRAGDVNAPNSMALPNARRLLAEGRFDRVLLHSYGNRFERQVVRAARRLGIPVTIRGDFCDPSLGRGPIKSFLREAYLRWFYARVSTFCYSGQEARDHLVRRGIPADRQFFAPYCVDAAFLLAQAAGFDREAVRRDLGIGVNDMALVFSGKFIPRKEPLLLLEALERLAPEHRPFLILLGDGPLRDRVTARGRTVLGDRFLPQGFVNQSMLGRFYRAADTFVLPSNFETWGLVVNEAMHFGLPVVVSDRVHCRRDLVVEGQTGYSFPSGDAEGLASVLRKLLDDREAARTMGVRAREHVAGYSVAAAAQGIADALRAAAKREP